MGDRVSRFTEKIIGIDTVPTGFAFSFSLSAMTPRQAAVLDAKHKVLKLAEELRRKNPNRGKLIQLFDDMEGSLQTLRALAVIDARRLSGLLSELKQMRATAWKH